MIVRFLSVIAAATLLLLAPAAGLASSPGERAVCSRPSTTRAGCFAKMLTSSGGAIQADASPEGYGPSQFKSAYRLSGTGNGSTIAVVDAYGDSHAESDLNEYSRIFGLPVLPPCTSAAQRSCFERLNQTGGHSYPANNSDWALETALDIEAAHAVCPGCRLELVQAKTASMSNLMAAAADPATGAAVYSSLSPGGNGGWFVVGGTSLAAPLVVGMVALAAPASQTSAIASLYSAQGTSVLHDVTSGSTGSCVTYLCQARAGYDGPTGVGAPRGINAF